MKPLQAPRRDLGYATMVVVSSVSLVILAMMGFGLIGNMRSFNVQARAQVKQDYTQKEDAILTALVHLVPNKAMGAMMQGSASNPSAYTWDTIFSEALAVANAQQSVSPQLLNALNLGTVVSANTGDTQFETVSQVVNAPCATYARGNNRVNGGNSWEYLMLENARIGPKIPAALQLSYDHYLLDKQYPIITHAKTYVNQYAKGLGLSATDYPRYNLIQYPDVKFGYKRPGEYFVAKRNWWVFSLKFGQHNEARTGIPPVQKDYVLSIYEIPSQIPLTASALMKVGKFRDGTAWQNVTLDGTVFADRLQTEGTVALEQGAISARRSLEFSGTTTVGGRAVASNFDAVGEREKRAVTTSPNGTQSGDSDFHDASVGGNVGKVAFLPINRGTNTFLTLSDGSDSERISPTGWNQYSCAARQAQMTLEILDTPSAADQIPTSIRVTYRDSNGANVIVTYTRGTNWPTDLQPGGTSFPFQTGELENQRDALIVHLDRFPTFINGLPGTGGMSRNNSLYIFPRTGHENVQIPSIPSLESDTAISLRGGADMTAYTHGFSLVSRYRVYIADTLNNVATTVPANSGLPTGHLFYPPISIFAPEKRFGESLVFTSPVDMRGQINSLKTGSGDTVNPLEFLDGADDRVSANLINAELVSLESPAELPPIHMMNWLVTIEEVQ